MGLASTKEFLSLMYSKLLKHCQKVALLDKSLCILECLSWVDRMKRYPHTHTHTQLVHATPLSMHGRSALDVTGMAYAREVYVRNEAKLQGLSHNLVIAFQEASQSFSDQVRIMGLHVVLGNKSLFQEENLLIVAVKFSGSYKLGVNHVKNLL